MPRVNPTDDNPAGHGRSRHRSGLVAPGGLIVGVERMRRTSIIMLCGTAHSSRKAKTLSLSQITSLIVTASILAMSWGILTLRTPVPWFRARVRRFDSLLQFLSLDTPGDFSRSMVLAGHFRFDDDLFSLQQEVHPCCAAGIRWRPFLGPDVVEMETQKTVQQILHVILIVNLERVPSFSPVPKLLGDKVESLQDLCDNVDHIPQGRSPRRSRSRTSEPATAEGSVLLV